MTDAEHDITVQVEVCVSHAFPKTSLKRIGKGVRATSQNTNASDYTTCILTRRTLRPPHSRVYHTSVITHDTISTLVRFINSEFTSPKTRHLQLRFDARD